MNQPRKPWGHLAETHGKSRTPVYRVWQSMRNRCENPKDKRYHDYGGRGIRVCERWQKFENFYADMGESMGLQLDRKDNDGNYCPENCRWATRQQQQRNRRTNQLVQINGVTLCVKEWCLGYGINWDSIYVRVCKRGETHAAVLQHFINKRFPNVKCVGINQEK
jgi:hypothetical protein